jgi:hypothetical protein
VTAYATQADFETYVEGWVTDNPDALARIMQRASRDIDRVCAGGEPDGTTGLKFSPTPDWFDDQQVQALKRACCAQTQYRLIRGEEFFIDYSPTRITGPDFNQEGKPPRLSPEARRELETSGIKPTSARMTPSVGRTVGPSPKTGVGIPLWDRVRGVF